MIHFPLFESICFCDDQFPLLEYHLERMHRSCEKLFSSSFQKEHELLQVIKGIHSKEKMKVRVEYDPKHMKVTSTLYQPKEIRTVRLITNDEISYSLKYTNRDVFLHYQHEQEEVLFVKNHLITESTFSNIACYNGKEWHTPKSPLLHGTRRRYLLDQHRILEKDLTIHELRNYSKISFINGMLDLDEMSFPVANIQC